MKPGVYKYENAAKRTVHFRGYVKTYKDATVTQHSCPHVRGSYFEAMKDAKKLLAKFRRANAKQTV